MKFAKRTQIQSGTSYKMGGPCTPRSQSYSVSFVVAHMAQLALRLYWCSSSSTWIARLNCNCRRLALTGFVPCHLRVQSVNPNPALHENFVAVGPGASLEALGLNLFFDCRALLGA